MARKHSKKKSGTLGDLFPVFPCWSEEAQREFDRSLTLDLGMEEATREFEEGLIASLRLDYPPDQAQERLKDHLKFPVLLDAPDEKFLSRTDNIAGRQVCADLYATNTTAQARCRAWQVARRLGADLQEIGRAAKMLERLNINWRLMREYNDILAAAMELSELPAH